MVSSAALPVWEAWAVYPKQLSSLTQILPNFRCLKGAQCIWKKKKKKPLLVLKRTCLFMSQTEPM